MGGGRATSDSCAVTPLRQRCALPPPRPGEEFAGNAAKLAGLAGLLFGWSPDTFWAATPAELAGLIDAATGDRAGPVDLAALMEKFPDG